MNIHQALTQLDPANDEHWTSDGMPRMDVVQGLTEDPKLTRKAVTDAAPDFNREMAIAAAASAEAPEAPETPEEDDVPEQEPTALEEGEPTPDVPEQEPDAQGDGELPDPDADEDEEFEDEPYILDLSLGEIFASEEMMIAFQAEANVVCLEWQKEKKRLEAAIVRLSNLSASADARLNRLKRSRPNHDTEELRGYLARQAQVREERAKRARAFLDQGINAGDLANTISGKSQLDQALNQRKPKLGSTRPAPRMPVRGRGA